MTCNKVKYKTEEYAQIDIDKIQRTSKRVKIPKRPYYCTKCNSWHITSTDLWQVKTVTDEVVKKDRQIANLEARIKHLETMVNGYEQKITNYKSELSKQFQNRALNKKNEKEIERLQEIVRMQSEVIETLINK